MLKYRANQTINIRSTPEVTSTNDTGDIPAGTEFTCEDVMVTGADGNKYVELISIGGVDINVKAYVSTKANITFLGSTGTPPVDPPVTVEFPQSYILTDNDPKSPNYGKRAEYVFIKVIE